MTPCPKRDPLFQDKSSWIRVSLTSRPGVRPSLRSW
jgi:hypothetical protein